MFCNTEVYSLPGFVYWKDCQSRYLSCNKNLATIAGLNEPNQIIGLKDFDLPWQEFAGSFVDADREVLSGRQHVMLHRAKHCDGTMLNAVTFKNPIKTQNHEIIGLAGVALLVEDRSLLIASDILRKLDAVNLPSEITENQVYKLDANYDYDLDVKLTPREQECLFFTLRGKSAKQIAKVLELSPRTVESYLESVRQKFGVTNRGELFEYAFKNKIINIALKSPMFKLEE